MLRFEERLVRFGYVITCFVINMFEFAYNISDPFATGKLNVKTRHPLSLCFGWQYTFGFQ